MLELTGAGKDFLNRTMVAKALRLTIDKKKNSMKLNGFSREKKTIIPVKRKPTEGEQISSPAIHMIQITVHIVQKTKNKDQEIKQPN